MLQTMNVSFCAYFYMVAGLPCIHLDEGDREMADG